MIYGTPQPTSSSHRDAASLDGTWNFVADRDDAGGGKNYHTGLPASKSTTISVPASWNEQLPELVGGGCKEWPPPDATLTKRW